MLKHFRTLTLAVALAAGGILGPGLLAGPFASAHEYKAGALEIGHPWTRATPAGARVGGGYFTVNNGGADDDRLVSASSPRAGRVEIHEMAVTDGVMTMRPLTDGLSVPAGGTVEFAPGGLHLMLIDLTAPLVEGESVPVELVFEKAGAVAIDLAVDRMGARAPSHGEGGAGHHAH